MGALAYLDYCYAKHQLGAILRSPGRLALWLPYVVMIAVLAVRRATLSTAGPTPDDIGITTVEAPLFATLAGGTYLVAFGLVMGLAGTGRFAAFRSRAEAFAFANAGLSSLSVAFWLQLRRFVGSWPRWILTVIYLFAFASPHSRSGPMSHVTLAALVAFAALAMVELPAFLASRRRFGGVVAPLGWTLVAVGAAYALLAALGPESWSHGIALVRLDPGRLLLAIVAGKGPAFALAAAVPAALAALAVVLGRDSMPELYRATTQAFARRERGAHRPARFHARALRAVVRIPAGSFAILWQDWVALRRRPGGLRLWLLAFALWGCAGLAIDYDLMVLGDLSIATALSSLALIASLSIALTASVTIADDLAKPIWWLGRDPLLARVAVWTVARSWRGGTSFAMLPLAIGFGTGDAPLALAGASSAVVAWWTLSALGAGLYAAFPSRIDERGPMVLLRLFGFGLLLAPAVAAGTLVQVLAHAPVLACFAASIVLAVEASGAIAFAAWRISENGAGIAALERAG
ncbi:MAG: hypothetical protein ACLPYS_05595 [Vulcanimicrobiaceae bacterium]